MSVQSTFTELVPNRQPSEKPEREVVFTANGSSKASRVARRAGALVGMESLNRRPPDDVPVDFIDWPFSKLDEYDDIEALFDAHLDVVRREGPRLAVAPDMDERVGFDRAMRFAEALRPYADTVIVVPKVVLPTDIPAGFRIGMPCQDRYGPPPWKWRHYRRCDEIHLLGGSPVDHRQIIKHVPVASVDTTVPVQSAGFGDYWNGRKWQSLPADSGGFYTALRLSYLNMRLTFNRGRTLRSVRQRNRRERWEAQFNESPERDLWALGEVPPQKTSR